MIRYQLHHWVCALAIHVAITTTLPQQVFPIVKDCPHTKSDVYANAVLRSWMLLAAFGGSYAQPYKKALFPASTPVLLCCTDTVVEYATLPDPPPLQLVSILISIHTVMCMQEPYRPCHELGAESLQAYLDERYDRQRLLQEGVLQHGVLYERVLQHGVLE